MTAGELEMPRRRPAATPESIPAAEPGATSAAADMPTYDPGQLWQKLMPEASTAVLAVVVGLGIAPNERGEMVLALMLFGEIATLMFMATLVDVASRLQRPPRWWVGVLLGGGIVAIYPELLTYLRNAWAEGLWIGLPFTWSLAERLRELWTLPRASRLEKVRRRALVFGRLYTGVVLFGASMLALLGVAVFGGEDLTVDQVMPLAFPWVLAVFYGTAAWDVWRVHRPAFARRPLNLWPWIDRGDSGELNPL